METNPMAVALENLGRAYLDADDRCAALERDKVDLIAALRFYVESAEVHVANLLKYDYLTDGGRQYVETWAAVQRTDINKGKALLDRLSPQP